MYDILIMTELRLFLKQMIIKQLNEFITKVSHKPMC